MNPLDSSVERLEAEGLIRRRKNNLTAKRSPVPSSLSEWLRANSDTFTITFDRYNTEADFSLPSPMRIAA